MEGCTTLNAAPDEVVACGTRVRKHNPGPKTHKQAHTVGEKGDRAYYAVKASNGCVRKNCPTHAAARTTNSFARAHFQAPLACVCTARRSSNRANGWRGRGDGISHQARARAVRAGRGAQRLLHLNGGAARRDVRGGAVPHTASSCPTRYAHVSHVSGHCTGPWPARAADGTASPFTDPSRRRALAGRLWRPARPRQADAQRALQRGAVDGAPLGEPPSASPPSAAARALAAAPAQHTRLPHRSNTHPNDAATSHLRLVHTPHLGRQTSAVCLGR